MQPGDWVRVRVYGGKFVERRVVEVTDGIVLITTGEEYETSAKEGRAPVCAGFRMDSVERMVSGDGQPGPDRLREAEKALS